MNIPGAITIETAKRLSLGQELEINRRAYAHNPTPLMRARFSALLLQNDLFDEVLEVLEPHDDLTFGERVVLTQALVSVENEQANRKAVAVLERSLEQAETELQQAQALAEMGKLQVRLGDPRAEDTLRHALRLDPSSKNACKRLATLLFNANRPEAVLEFANELAGMGICHSRLLAAQVLALTRLGRVDEARRLDGRRQLGMAAVLDPPEGFTTIEDFNAALSAQLLAHPGLRYERYGTASEKTWRIDSPNSADAPLVGVLMREIRKRIGAHLAALADTDHPWLRGAPDEAILHCWCVITEGNGYETWHVHQFGWLSGVYYVAVPDDVVLSNEPGGCIAFGLPDELVGEDSANAFGEDMIRPAPGHMRTFPSHSYHRTFPHNSTKRRICIAYDFWPA